jgi:hypothetical protein
MAETNTRFLDFISAAKKNKRLTRKFMRIEDPKELREFFVAEGYSRIFLPECKKLIHYKKNLPSVIKKDIDKKGAY